MKMKTCILLSLQLIISTLLASKEISAHNVLFKPVEPDSNIMQFEDCFKEPDSIDNKLTIGCDGGYYKLINDQYVLWITDDIQVDINKCVRLTVDSTDKKVKAKLLVFKKGEASLTNLCTDVIIVNAPKPIRTINSCEGKFSIGKSDPTNYYGNILPKMTMRIDYLKFIDPLDETIIIENEVFWKVLNRGIPG